ncbi:MAG: hypothetical protein ACUZ8E_03065 [Candidatus Anammoxibacter sp.]
MKKVILFVFVLVGLNGYAQDFEIDSDVSYAKGIISIAPNMVKLNYSHISRISDDVWLWEPQFSIFDSLGHRLPQSVLELSKQVFTITAEQANFTIDSLMQIFYLPYLEINFPGKVTKDKTVFNKK